MRDIQLIYYSESRVAARDGSRLGQFQSIQRTSEVNNRRREITGALAYDDLWFLQVLEGEREVVWSVFRTIMDDPRHDEVALVECVPIETRRFGDWAMRLVRPTAAASLYLAPFKTDGLLRPRLMTGTDIVTALAAMIASEGPRASAGGEREHAGFVPRATAVAP